VITTSNAIVMRASPQTIFALASATERWPELLPHYRYVRVLRDDGLLRVVEMAAWRDRIPIRWTAEQTNDPVRPHIGFKHVAGWTKGMDVEWIFTPCAEGTEVRIEHRLAFQFPIAAEWLGKHVVGDYFVHDVASKTLATMKRLVEDG
jgi:ribosome-associated toxin RatA of RatAB toxin-antitoxin module